jgi:aspartokinase/homoserine dehydrogenase 1
MIPRAKQAGIALRVVAAVDRSGFVFEQRGLSRRRLEDFVAGKEAGRKIAGMPGGRAAGVAEAIAEIARHALSRPILVDVTAEDTAAVLRQWLASGHDLVLANKKPLAGPLEQARGLLDLARSRGRRILHETTVGAGLPIIDTLYKLVESNDRILRIVGCTSGTLGFLLGEIQKGRPFSGALQEAMKLGYTEPDPREDLSGMDVARKALILGRLVGFEGELDRIEVESLVPEALRGVTREEFLRRTGEMDRALEERSREAQAGGGFLRYVASITRRQVKVGLQAVPASSPFASLKGTDNQVAFTTVRYRRNPLVITGPGAGPDVTAAGVLNDILSLAGSA